MADQRKEPTLSSTAFDTSDRISSKSTEGAGTSRANTSRTKAPQYILKRQPSVMLGFTLIVAVLAVIGTGYIGWLLFNSQQLMKQQQLRLDELAANFAVSDGESTQSLTVLSANLRTMSNDVKLSLSEVDKLWAARNVNRKAIAQNKDALTKAQKELAAAEATLLKPIDSLQTAFAEQKQVLTALENKYAAQEKLIASLKNDAAEQEILVQSLRERVATESKQYQALVANAQDSAAALQALESLSATVAANAEAVTAFDAFRRTVNQDILFLKQRAGPQ
ncbi:MAG: hypothetical protein KTR20_06540 [Cellvibrionaceae bacterium]|nr:hypothetical protein [Cellvibrionaceae bacterium]